MPLFLAGTVGDQPRVWPLDAPTLSIGRSSRHAIQIPHATVSKDHAEIVREGDRYLIRDLGSRNGTRVNGREANEAIILSPGDRVEIGHVPLEINDGQPQRIRLNEATVLGSSLRLRLEDVLERQTNTGARSANVLHLLAEAGQILVLPRPLRETCDEILTFVERAIPASRYVMLLVEAGREEPVQIAARARGDSTRHPLALSKSIMNVVLAECTSVLTRDASMDPRFAGQQSIVAQAVHSAMAVPLFDNERVLGLVYVDTQDLRIQFGEDQLEILTLLANMAAVKITNARLFEAEQQRARIAQELGTATRIQRELLPETPPTLPGYTFDALIETCYEVGGDLYDFVVHPDGRVLMVVGDVSGKGMGAALLMSSFLASARVLGDAVEDLGELATRLGVLTHRLAGSGRFVTGFIARLDPASGRLEYVNAGHPAPMLLLGDEVRELDSTGVPFGVLPNYAYASSSVTMRPGETLVAFSDGLTEAQQGEEQFGDRLLREVVLEASREAELERVRRHIVERMVAFLDGAPRTDDVTLLLARRGAAPAAGAASAA